MCAHSLVMTHMVFLTRVLGWFNRAIINRSKAQLLLANEMMYTAFDEKGIEPNPFRSRMSNSMSTDCICIRFAETLKLHQELLSIIVYKENVDGNMLSNLMPQLALALREYYGMLDEDNRIAIGIFLCRYAVLCYDRGIHNAPMFIIVVVAGMGSRFNWSQLQKNETPSETGSKHMNF